MYKLVLDFETASACNLKEAGAWRYSEDITTEVISLSFGFMGETNLSTWVPNPQPPDNLELDIECEVAFDLRDFALNPEIVFVAHNSGFEKAIWRNIMVAAYGYPDIPNERWEDTAASCAMKAIPINLDRASLALRLPVLKDKEGSRITKSLSKANKKGFYNRDRLILERVYAYNRQDVLATQELSMRVGSLPEGEHKVWLLDQTINERGVGLDLEFVRAARSIVDKASLPLIEEFRQITGGLKPTQTAKIKAWMLTLGVKLDSLNKEVVQQLLGENEEGEDDDDIGSDDSSVALSDLPAVVHRALVIRSLVGSASVKKLARMQKCICMDGRARGLLQYHGASPGRWAGRLLQPHNFPRGTIKDSNDEKPSGDILVPLIMSGEPDILETCIGPAIETIVSSLRHAIQAAPGHKFLSGDFMTIEARFVLALAGQHDKTALIASGQDVYCDMARSIYKRLIDKKKDPEERQIGKNSVLGLGFQMGWKKFKLRYGKDKTDEFCQKVVETYRQEWAPLVPKVWEALGEAALQTVIKLKPHSAYGVEYRLEDGWLTARLPSGRKLWYFNPQPGRKAVPWDENDIRICWTYQQMKTGQFKTIYAFGGLLTENVVQALARDMMVHAMFQLEANGFPIVLTVHDEIVCEPLIANADEKAFAQIMQDRPQWAKDLQVPISVETWAGDRYRK